MANTFVFLFSYFITNVAIRAEEFNTVLVLSSLFSEKSIFAISLLSLISTSAAILFSSLIGYVIDKVNRRASIGFLVVQKLCICLTSILLLSRLNFDYNSFGLLASPSSGDSSNSIGDFDTIFALIVTFQTLLRISGTGVQITIEKDWPTVIADGDMMLLSNLNANLKKTDLFCKLVIPLLVALLSEATSMQRVTLFIASFSAIAIFIEFACMLSVYSAFPNLSMKWRQHVVANEESSSSNCEPSPGLNLFATESSPLLAPPPPPPYLAFMSSAISTTSSDLTLEEEKPITLLQLFKLPVFLTSISISLLYLNILAFNQILISFLISKGIDASTIASTRAVCVLCGLGATFSFPPLVKKFGLVKVGVFALWFQACALTVTVSSFYFDPSLSGTQSLLFLFGGIALSRWALWSFDMSQTQILQESLPNDIGLAAGVQVSTQNFFELLSFAVTVVFSKPEEFFIPTFISLGAVFLGAIVFSGYAMIVSSRKR